MHDIALIFHDFPGPLLFSMTFQAWKLVCLNSRTSDLWNSVTQKRRSSNVLIIILYLLHGAYRTLLSVFRWHSRTNFKHFQDHLRPVSMSFQDGLVERLRLSYKFNYLVCLRLKFGDFPATSLNQMLICCKPSLTKHLSWGISPQFLICVLILAELTASFSTN